jgi:hypothetical protein
MASDLILGINNVLIIIIFISIKYYLCHHRSYLFNWIWVQQLEKCIMGRYL